MRSRDDEGFLCAVAIIVAFIGAVIGIAWLVLHFQNARCEALGGVVIQRYCIDKKVVLN